MFELFTTDSAGMHVWAIATAAMVSAGAALVGTLLVVRRMSLLGDAISHAVLPGIVIAVLAGGRPGGMFVLGGAVAAGLMTVWLTQTLRSQGGLAEDASAGVVFTTLFALGVVIITAAATRIDLDPACVLYGVLELIPFDTVAIGGLEIPRAFVTASVVFVVLAAAMILSWKAQVFTAFDADAALAAGVPVGIVTTGLLAATALASVAGFEAVGAILVVAMLVVPAAAAELLVRRLSLIAIVAMLLAVVGSAVGYLAAWHLNTSAAGMIAVVLGIEYLIAALLAPDDGLLSRGLSRAWLAWRIACEDALAMLYRMEEDATGLQAFGKRGPPCNFRYRMALAWLSFSGRVKSSPEGFTLLLRGRDEAKLVVRSHRLWEAWLGRHADIPLDHLHPPAEWVEHHLGAAIRQRIEAEVGWLESDPHGREIPPERRNRDL